MGEKGIPTHTKGVRGKGLPAAPCAYPYILNKEMLLSLSSLNIYQIRLQHSYDKAPNPQFMLFNGIVNGANHDKAIVKVGSKSLIDVNGREGKILQATTFFFTS